MKIENKEKYLKILGKIFEGERKNIPIKKIAKSIGYSEMLISEWERGKKEPTALGLIRLNQIYKGRIFQKIKKISFPSRQN